MYLPLIIVVVRGRIEAFKYVHSQFRKTSPKHAQTLALFEQHYMKQYLSKQRAHSEEVHSTNHQLNIARNMTQNEIQFLLAVHSSCT